VSRALHYCQHAPMRLNQDLKPDFVTDDATTFKLIKFCHFNRNISPGKTGYSSQLLNVPNIALYRHYVTMFELHACHFVARSHIFLFKVLNKVDDIDLSFYMSVNGRKFRLILFENKSPLTRKHCPYPFCGSPSLLSNEQQRLFPRGISGRVVEQTTHLQPVPRSRKRGTIYPLPYTSSWSGAKFVKHRENFLINEENIRAERNVKYPRVLKCKKMRLENHSARSMVMGNAYIFG
jgi:hypothetical protein